MMDGKLVWNCVRLETSSSLILKSIVIVTASNDNCLAQKEYTEMKKAMFLRQNHWQGLWNSAPAGDYIETGIRKGMNWSLTLHNVKPLYHLASNTHRLRATIYIFREHTNIFTWIHITFRTDISFQNIKLIIVRELYCVWWHYKYQ